VRSKKLANKNKQTTVPEAQPTEQGANNNEIQQIKELGTTSLPQEVSNIHCLSVIG